MGACVPKASGAMADVEAAAKSSGPRMPAAALPMISQTLFSKGPKYWGLGRLVASGALGIWRG